MSLGLLKIMDHALIDIMIARNKVNQATREKLNRKVTGFLLLNRKELLNILQYDCQFFSSAHLYPAFCPYW